MPEGPEIRRAADAIAAVLEGQVVETARFSLPRLRHYGRQLSGHQVTGIETRGKALLTHFEHGLTIYSHNQLYGVWRVVKGHALPRSNRSLRLTLATATHSALLYSASDISVWPRERLEEHPFLQRIGPDILNPALGWREIAERLAAPQFRKRSLASLYLDQAFIAGLGNYLRSEILFDAGLAPATRPSELSRGERGRLARSTLAITQRSYATGGITNPPLRVKRLRADGARRGQLRFAVFGRAGRGCYGCGGRVRRIDVSSRRLYYCPSCQPGR